MKSRRRMFVISNMYPSNRNIRYGIFVSRFIESFQKDFQIEKVVLTKKYSLLSKFTAYVKLYVMVIFALFKSQKADLIYVHFPLYFSYLLIPFILFNRSIVLNFHGNDALFDTALKKFLSFGLKWVARRASLIVVPSSYYRHRIINLMQVKEVEICVYPSGGISTSIFHPLPKGENTDFVFGYVSNFIREKGWKIFLEALMILRDIYPKGQYRAIMVGDGPDKDQIQHQINLKKLPVSVLDSVSQLQLAKQYAEFDVFVFPTYREAESLGLVGLEAMACGVPVLASMVGGPMGYIIPGYNGFLFEKKDSKSLARLMHRFMLMSKLELSQMKENCIRSAGEYEGDKVKQSLLNSLKAI